MKKFIAILICIVMTFSLAFSTACAGQQGQQGITPQLRISAITNEWEVSYDNGLNWTSLGVKATGEKGDKGDTGKPGAPGSVEGITPQLRISAITNEWEISYDNGVNWTSLGVKATGEKGDKGDTGATGNAGTQGITPQLRINETTNEWEVSYDNGVNWTSLGVKASCDCENSGESDTPDYANFVPVTRFAVVSDVHVRPEGVYQSKDRLNSVLDSVWAYAEAQTDYSELDGLFFLGDNTQTGRDVEYEVFFNAVNEKTQGDTTVRAIMGNHEFKYINGSKYTPTHMEAGIEYFLENSGYEEEDAHYTIDGYHHILISMDRYGINSGAEYAGVTLSETKIAWLEEQLEAAVADDPTGEKPIFVYQHMAPQETMFGGGSDVDLKELLNQYPNVVDFSGHSHRDMSDPRCIWQGDFTAVAVGSMAYTSLHIVGNEDVGGVSEVDANGAWVAGDQEKSVRNGVMYYICEISEENVLRLLRYNVETDSIYGDPIYIDSFGDPTGFDYTEDKIDKSVTPTFKASDTVSILANHYNKTRIQFPQATCENSIVQNYRVDVLDENNVLLKSEYRFARSYMGDAKPDNLQVTISGLDPESKYTFKVYAVSPYGVASAPISSAEVTTSAKSDEPIADILSVAFNTDGTATNVANGTKLTEKHLSSHVTTVVADADLGRNIAQFSGGSAYIFKDMDDWFTTMQNSFTIELYVSITGTSTKVMGLASSKQGGGLEIGYKTTGALNFQISTFGGQTAQVNTTDTYAAGTGEWLHIVGVYDGDAINLYVNGVLVASNTVTGVFEHGCYLTHYIAIGAGATSNYGIDTYSKCNMATFNIYSDALTAQEISKLYSAYNAQ